MAKRKAASDRFLSIDNLPIEWGSSALGELVALKNGTTFNANDWKDSGVPIIRIQNLKDPHAPFNYYQGSLGSTVSICRGDLLFSWSGSKGTSFGPHLWMGAPGVLNQHIFKVEIREGKAIDKEYLYYSLRHLTATIEEKAYGVAALVHVRKGDLESTTIPIPPMKEQRAIAHILRTVQRAKEATERIIAASHQLKRSLVEYLFSFGPITPENAERAEQREFCGGRMPAHWQEIRLKDALRESLRNGHSAQTTESKDGIRTLTLTAITQNDFSIKNTKLTSANPERVRNLWLKYGDIFIERANTPDYVGLAAIYEGADDFAIFPDLLIRIRCHLKKMDPNFLAEALLLPASRKYFRMNAKKTAGNFPKIDQHIIENTPIPQPPLGEQKEISKMLSVLNVKRCAEERRKAALENLFQTLLQGLMTGQIRLPEFVAGSAK